MPAAVALAGRHALAPAASGALVSTMDIFPTVLGAAGVLLPKAYAVDGRDMSALLASPRRRALRTASSCTIAAFASSGDAGQQPMEALLGHAAMVHVRRGRLLDLHGVLQRHQHCWTGRRRRNATRLCGCADHDLASQKLSP